MDYIDREVAIKTAVENYKSNNQFDVLEMVEAMEDIPTADVVKVRHSRWQKISGFDVCNICGTSPAYWEPEPNNPKGYPPYCHNCGAKMDGGKEE